MLKQVMKKCGCLKIDSVGETAFDGHYNVKLDGKHDWMHYLEKLDHIEKKIVKSILSDTTLL